MTDYLEEIRLSRELMKAIDQEMQSFGEVVPYSVSVAYQRLRDLYKKQIDEGVM